MNYDHFPCSKNANKQILLHVAAAGGHINIIKMLIDAQANISAKDSDWNTPLHIAAKYGRVEAVKYLMQIADEQQAKAEAENKDRKQNGKASDGDDEAVDKDEYLLGVDYTYLDEVILNGQRYNTV